MMTATRPSENRASLDDRIDALNRHTTESSPAKGVIKAVSDILALVRDKKIDNKDSMQLTECCVVVCETVENVIRGKHEGGLDESKRTAVDMAEGAMRKIKQTLRRGASTPQTRGKEKKIKDCLLEAQQLLNTLNTLSPPSDEDACGRLIRREYLPSELPLLIEGILLSKGIVGALHRLHVDDAQVLADVVYDTIGAPHLPLLTRKKCLKLLYKMCGYYALVPKTFMVLVVYDRVSDALFHGGFADVWKGDFIGREVAVKVIRTDSRSVLKKVTERFCKEVVMWKFLRHPNIVPIIGVLMLEFKFAMVSEWMANGIINEYIKAHPEVNRLGLLEGVARGLIYLHDIGLIHGDLKGSNILIDEAGQARLVDFGLMKIISDPVNNLPTSSNSQEGTLRWMSPELAYPDQYGLKKSSPTKSSDCYAFGMVIYEVIGGNPPFHEHRKPAVYLKLSRREHPSRGTSFTDSQWEVLGLCWASDPTHRPSIEVVLHRLQSAQTLPQLPSGQGGEVEKDGDESDSDRSAICDRLVEDYVKQSVQS